MPFIRTQNMVYQDDGSITHGTAYIIDTEYIKSGKYHSRQVTRERLGKVISMEGDRKSGIFLSPSRGLVKYDAVTDTFQPVGKENLHLDGKAGFPPAEIHTVFGDTYLLLNFLEKSNLI